MEEGELTEDAAKPPTKTSGGIKFLSKKQRELIRQQTQAEEALKQTNKDEEWQLKQQAFRQQLQQEKLKADEEKRQQSVVTKDEDELTAEESAERAYRLEIEQLKNEYLGVKQDRRKLQKPSEKFRNVFQFEWDDDDDTTKRDFNPIYTQKYEPQLLFGRGFRAGIDVREQRKRNTFYDELAAQHQAPQAKRQKLELSDEDEFETVETKPLARMTDRDWRIFREDYNIVVKNGRRPPNPIRNWSDIRLDDTIIGAIHRSGYQRPTPIQMQAIPIGLAHMDMIGIAETGSGKTCAFMIPLISYVNKLPRLTEETAQRGPYGLVLAPARELALQIREEGCKFTDSGSMLSTKRDSPPDRPIRIIPIVGGRNAEDQAQQLRGGVEIIVATPGRLKDCLERAYTVLTQCNYVVLDEADRMIDMGLEKEVNDILDQIPSSKLENWSGELEQLRSQAGYRDIRITHMFTATMPPSVEKMAKTYLKDPCIVQIGIPGEKKTNIEQKVENVHPLKKQTRLVEVLKAHFRSQDAREGGGVIVFVNQKKSADVISRVLNQNGISSVSFHGGKMQDVREETLESFRNQAVSVLVATDVAGRGLDVDDVQLVVNFDMPADIETYTHRIGRTGRAGKKGQAISFLTDDDPQYLVEALKPSSV